MKTVKQYSDLRRKLTAAANRAKAIETFALERCKGWGVDYGYGDTISGKQGVEYILPGAVGVDLGVAKYPGGEELRAEWITHMKFPDGLNTLEYVFSSHVLEHILEWQLTLEYWVSLLKTGGVLFLYLPHVSIPNWHPDNVWPQHVWSPDLRYLTAFLPKIGVIPTEGLDGRDTEGSFYIVGKKA